MRGGIQMPEKDLTLAEWKNKVIEAQGVDGFGEPYITPAGELCFEWHGFTYGCMGLNEDPFIVPPETAWIGIDRHKMKKYTGLPIDWNQKISKE